MFCPIRSLSEGSYFVCETGAKGQRGEDLGGFVKVEYLDRGGKRKRSEWSPATAVCQLNTSPFEAAPEKRTKPVPGGSAVAQVSPRPLGKEPATTAAAPINSARQTFLGHSLTSLLRWMGGQKWSPERAREALARHGITCSEGTLKAKMRPTPAGKSGYTAAAPLTADEIARLEPPVVAAAPAKKRQRMKPTAAPTKKVGKK